ncbi:hypothetical protein [Pseudarthrobacter sp. MM222]|uniref:hypothetical protein n=1 Tax=Pseudarthrobacter sp. MM222 TaxID=3018929 RepID=UPI002220B6EF|nr:hypothetical protein [Pseudarthrobacter sp. MM222]CAI3797459.1 hypothetical protein NKCBBBOE_01832 [Pseudarthrobacter sp. MM222]
MLGRTGRILFGGAAALLLLSGCGVGSAVDPAPSPGMAGTSVSDALVAEVTGPDPLAITGEQAKICAQQTPGGFSRFAILIHNTTGSSFTINSVTLVQPESLSITSAQAAPANRAGHGNHGTAPGPGTAAAAPAPAPATSGHAGHTSAAPTSDAPGADRTPPSEPGPAAGYEVRPGAHLDLIVDVAVAAAAQTGTARNVEVKYSAIERDYSALQNLELEVRKGACS